MKLAPGQTASPHLIGTYNRNNCTSGAEMLLLNLTPEFFLSHASSDNFSTGSHSIPWSLTTCCLSSLQPVFGRWLLIPQTSQNKHTPFHSMAWQCASHCQGVQKKLAPRLGLGSAGTKGQFFEEAQAPMGYVATQPQAPPTIAVCSPERGSRDRRRAFIQSGVRTGAPRWEFRRRKPAGSVDDSRSL